MVAKGVLCRALAERVLEPEDLQECGHPHAPPEDVLEALIVAGRLRADVRAALEGLERVRAEEVPGTSSGTRDAGAPTIAPRGRTALPGRRTRGTGAGGPVTSPATATLAPERAPCARASATLAPERAPRASRRGVLLGGVGEGTLAPERSPTDVDEHRLVLAAAVSRMALAAGLLTPEQLRAAWSADGALQVTLAIAAAVEPDDMQRLVELRSTPRLTCHECVEVVDGAGRCPRCGREPSTWRARRRAHEQGDIEGFPGEGGRFAGHELLHRLAEGGMGVVFKVRQENLNRTVALKVMRGGSLASAERRRRFLLEAESAAGLTHPSIVAIHEIGEAAGYPFYTMDYVDGPPLHEWARGASCQVVARIVRAVAEAVQHFHVHGIIHRDLKPENVLVGPGDLPKIIDFGIAKRLGCETESHTVDGDVIGTPHYMAPEQAAGRVRDVDTRTDVYALGTILYELLAGAPPWSELPGALLMAAILEDDPEPLRRKNPLVEPDLEAIVLKAMAKDRERRYQSAAELALDLARYEQNLPVVARRAGPLYRARKAIRRRLPLFLATSACAAVGGAVLVHAVWQEQARRREVAALLAQARDASRPDAGELVGRALFLDPDNAEARAQRELLAERRRNEERLREERSRQAVERAQTELARERAEREAQAATERERARVAAERRTLDEARARGRALLARAEETRDLLSAIADVQDVLALLPPEERDVREVAGATKLRLAVALTRAAVADDELTMARFWLRHVSDVAHLDSTQVVPGLAAEVERLATGDRVLDEARDAIRRERWLTARALLTRARGQGVSDERLRPEEALVGERCAATCAGLVARGRAALGRGDLAGALPLARQALSFDATDGSARALVRDCEGAFLERARTLAARWGALDGDQARALDALAEAAKLIEDPELRRALERERRARTALVEDAGLRGLTYVAPVPALMQDVAFYVQTCEVTNADYLEFVRAGGYRDRSLWDADGWAVVEELRDACAACDHRAPRVWSDGALDPALAELPVRGVSAWEAAAYARWRSRVEGGRWRLPTEREWEVAAGWDPARRTLRRFPWGDELLDGALVSGAPLPSPAAARTADVSALGVRHMAGNVVEWVVRGCGRAGTKGSAFAADPLAAEHFGAVRITGRPAPHPSRELEAWIGFRLVRELDEEER